MILRYNETSNQLKWCSKSKIVISGRLESAPISNVLERNKQKSEHYLDYLLFSPTLELMSDYTSVHGWFHAKYKQL